MKNYTHVIKNNPSPLKISTQRRALFLSIFMGLWLAACGGDSGQQVEQNPDRTRVITDSNVYTGPSPNSTDVQNFRLNFWENVIPTNRCGQCHNDEGQAPKFARTDDVNLAYNAVNSYINLSTPESSSLVTKVAGGHNCWLSNNDICGDILTAYIRAWSGETLEAGNNTVTLSAPAIKDPGTSKTFPTSSASFATTLYPTLNTYCSECHSESADFSISPYFASADLDTAYAAVQAKISLETPADSRLVIRLRDEFHNCWGNCTEDATTMRNAIQAYADTIPTTSVNPSWVTSKALNLLNDGVAANAGGRYEANAIAKYEFKTGQGSTAFDTSTTSPALDLTLSGNVEWVSSWGLRFLGGKAQGQTTGSQKLFNEITSTGEYSIEAWVAPNNVTQEGPARIVSYSGGTEQRNFTLGQTLYNYDALNRSASTNVNGMPSLSTADADERLQATLQHVVVNYDPENGRRIFVNGVFTGDVDPSAGASLGNWDNTFVLILGNEASNNRPWQGVIRQLVIHNRALTNEQIANNFEVGVGQKFYLLFSIAELLGTTDTYIAFEVSQFDSYSYLFNAPFLVGLTGQPAFVQTPIKGMRIGINGKEASIGQAFARLAVNLDPNLYEEGNGQPLSPLGTIIPLELGPGSDEFFLTFENFGTREFVRTPAGFSALSGSTDSTQSSDIGLRNFSEINATLASLTGVAPSNAAVRSTYSTIQQQLPTNENMESFLSSHQMAITQLAISYCNAFIEDNTLTAAKLPTFNSTQGPSIVFTTPGRTSHVTELYNAFIGATDLASQPARADFSTEIQNLLTRLIDDCSTCQDNGDRTKTIAKATCAATLGSAVMLVQ